MKPLSCSQTKVDADSRMEGDIEFSNPNDEIGDISVFFVLEWAIEEFVIFILSFSPLVDDAFDRGFSICEIFHCSKVYFQIWFFATRQVVDFLEVHFLD